MHSVLSLTYASHSRIMSIVSYLLALLSILIAYLLGSIPFAVVVSRAMRLRDPRTFGSRNPGATNVLRSGNKKAAALTLLGDILKGWVAVTAAVWATTAFGLPDLAIALCAIAVFLGHILPVFLNFKGGKGVATALGILLALNPWLALATAATWLIVAYATKYSSLAAIAAAIFAPLYFILGSNVVWPMNRGYIVAIIVISVILLFRHQDNIGRLMRGKESKIGSSK